MRAAALACEMGRGAAFVLAASRLAFCGGFDLGDPEVLAEAAAAASIPLDLCLNAAGCATRDGEIEDASRRLVAMGADELPVLRVGRTLFSGESRLPEALAAASAASASSAPRPISA
jgi:2-hydroxychromene-2-carboxylate isomerase